MPGTPTVVRTPRLERLTVAPRLPTEIEVPRLPTLSRTPGINFTDRRILHPIARSIAREFEDDGEGWGTGQCRSRRFFCRTFEHLGRSKDHAGRERACRAAISNCASPSSSSMSIPRALSRYASVSSSATNTSRRAPLPRATLRITVSSTVFSFGMRKRYSSGPTAAAARFRVALHPSRQPSGIVSIAAGRQPAAGLGGYTRGSFCVPAIVEGVSGRCRTTNQRSTPAGGTDRRSAVRSWWSETNGGVMSDRVDRFTRGMYPGQRRRPSHAGEDTQTMTLLVVGANSRSTKRHGEVVARERLRHVVEQPLVSAE